MKRLAYVAFLFLLFVAPGFAQDAGLYRVLRNGLWGFVDADGQIAIPTTYDYVYPFSGDFTVVRIGLFANGQRAFLRSDGVQITDFVFDRAYHFVNGFAIVMRAGRWGFVDPTGSLVGGLQWGAVRNFQDGYAAVRVGDRRSGLWGLIDQTGAYLLEPVYEEVTYVGEGYWAVEKDQGVALIRSGDGAPTEFPFRSVSRFRDGLIAVAVPTGDSGAEYRVLDRELSVRLSTADQILSVSGGVARMSVEGRYLYREVESGEVIGREDGYDWALDFQDGFAIVGAGESWSSRRHGVIGRDGRSRVPTVYRRIRPVEGADLFMVLAGNWGLIDHDGRLVADTVYAQIGGFQNGLAPVQRDDLWGYVDTSGAHAIPLQWQAASEFVDGIAVVREGDRDSGERWYIDTTGDYLFERSFDWAYTFTGPVAHVAEGDFSTGVFGYIDREGRTVWQLSN